ncbi:hypothetical protein [Rhodonellum sp.]|uniref:hypothetical protein n=1 Tax=Rhodonellum sp. TaxID=2231180 RepID=UPI002724F60C|nr:hypothetical protein [Rhodonellum sp.]MDO9553722.1 hypothetical protein [Rhodonellum sp.]
MFKFLRGLFTEAPIVTVPKIENELIRTFEKNIEYYKNNTCPHCQFQYPEEIKRKRKCKNCSNEIFREYIESTKERVLLKGEEFKKFKLIEEEINLIKWIQKECEYFNIDFKNVENLSKERKLKIQDIFWGELNKVSIELFSKRKFGKYSLLRRMMVIFLKKENRIEKGLFLVFESLFLELNGCDDNLNKQFDLQLSHILDVDLGHLSLIEEKINLDVDDMKSKFISHCKPLFMKGMIYNSEEAWELINSRLNPMG